MFTRPFLHEHAQASRSTGSLKRRQDAGGVETLAFLNFSL